MPESFESRLQILGVELPPIPTPLGNYVPFVLSGNLLFLAGQGARHPDGSWLRGKVGHTVSVDEAYSHARHVGLTLLSAVKAAIGTLDRVDRVVKLLGFVNSTDDFQDHPQVINGCSDLMVEVFGQQGKHARSAVGVSGLPEGVSVEIEAIFEVR